MKSRGGRARPEWEEPMRAIEAREIPSHDDHPHEVPIPLTSQIRLAGQ